MGLELNIAICQKILLEHNLKIKLHAYGTNIEGDWDDVFRAIKKWHEAVHGKGAPRISTSIKVGTRIYKDQSMDDKITSVEEKLKINYHWFG